MLISSGDSPGQPSIQYLPDLSTEERYRRHGRGRCEFLHPLIAGDYTTGVFTFEIGADGLRAGGRLGVAWIWPHDWGDLQTEQPEAEGYSATAIQQAKRDSEATLDVRYHRLWGVDRWNHLLELGLTAGELAQGDRVTLVCGDRNMGGPGWRTPTCRASTAHFLMLIAPNGDDQWLCLVDRPEYSILAGPPTRLVAVAPSEVVVGEPQTILVRAVDQWGNPTLIPTGAPHLFLSPYPKSQLPSKKKLEGVGTVGPGHCPDAASAYHFPVTFTHAGLYQVAASVAGTELTTVSNPIRVHATPPIHRIFWGDLHSGQSEIGCGAGTLREHYTYARDVAGLQFTTHQANDHHVTPAEWRHTRAETQAFNTPGRFVVFLGCEWSPQTVNGGDRNVIYRHDEPRLRRSGRYFRDTEPVSEPDVPTAPEFHTTFGKEPVLINLHVGGRPTNLNYHAPEIERLAEIQSTHGIWEWFIEDALRRGYQVGITAGTDGVMGRPGACSPGRRQIRNIRNGLTAVSATALTPDALWDALQARRCYATSGERIWLSVDVDGRPMGAAYTTRAEPLVHISVAGTAPLERVDLLCGTTILQSWHMAQPIASPWALGQSGSGPLRILWGGTQAYGSAQAQRVVWDGRLEVVGGHILGYQSIDFQSPCDLVRQDSPATLAWQSATAGNLAGLTLKIDGGPETECRFYSAPGAFSFRLQEASLARLRFEAGGLDRHVIVGPALQEDGPESIELIYTHPTPPQPRQAGHTYPYWVRVVQINQARAWSSPVYVTFANTATATVV